MSSESNPHHQSSYLLQNHAQNVRVCMNCAKITRERGALEECCADRGDALSWCRRIYEFTSLLG